MMNISEAINEIQTKWWLNNNTTIQNIRNYYYEITGLSNLSTGKMLDYLYKYIIESMYRDSDITDDTAKQLYVYLGMEEE